MYEWQEITFREYNQDSTLHLRLSVLLFLCLHPPAPEKNPTFQQKQNPEAHGLFTIEV